MTRQAPDTAVSSGSYISYLARLLARDAIARTRHSREQCQEPCGDREERSKRVIQERDRAR